MPYFGYGQNTFADFGFFSFIFQKLVPSLVESIKAAGLVLVMDLSADGGSEGIVDKVDGTLEDSGAVLRFKDTVDV